MVVMIFIKWGTDWGYNWDDTAPNLISILMNLILKLGSLDEQNPLWGDGTDQESLQQLLLLIALICIPVMLLVKPLVLRCKHAAIAKKLEADIEMQETTSLHTPSGVPY
jgi:V-type H+-transporting ATPase subunit a